MEKAASAIIHLDHKTVVLAVNSEQLAVREEGDLITAEIVAVEPASKSA